MRVAALGMEAALAPAVGALLGYGLDRRWGFGWGIPVGLAVGFLAAARLIREILRAQKGDE